jgi:outer membrane protein
MKKLHILIALFSCAAFATAQETVLSVSATPDASSQQQVIIQPQHFGYLSWNEVLRAMPEHAQAMKSLEEMKKTYDDEMARAEQDFSKKFTEYLDGQKTFPENIMLKRQKELQQLMEQSLQFQKEAQELLTKAEAELLEPVRARLTEAIQAVGKQRNYAYVLNTDSNAYPYVGSDGENCTDAVLIQLGIK